MGKRTGHALRRIIIEVDMDQKAADELAAELVDYMIHVEQIVPSSYWEEAVE